MHQAMHDAMNAAAPTYERWFDAESDEPSADGALPGAAMAAAAGKVLTLLYPARKEDTEQMLGRSLARLEAGAARDQGVRLGEAIGAAAVARRVNDGSADSRSFVGRDGVGVWSLTPETFQTSKTDSTEPFLFNSRESFPQLPPPAVDSDQFRRDLEETRRIGGVNSPIRKYDQYEAAIFWAYQSSQRGYLNLAIRLLRDNRLDGGLAEHARAMSQYAAAMADSAILIWLEKERYSFWRPVTAIQAGAPGVKADPTWLALVETPPFPEYPSGHASDCFTGSAMLELIFGKAVGPIVYESQSGKERARSGQTLGVGQHEQGYEHAFNYQRKFPTLAAAAHECSESRIWAGAHYRFSEDEAKRVGELIADRAHEAVQRLK